MVSDINLTNLCDELREEGISSRGYGCLPKFPMLDPDLSIEAKGIYAYFCSYRGAGNCAFPRYQKIIADLKINKDTYYKHFRQLEANGYILIEKKPSDKPGFMKNVYRIHLHPPKFAALPEKEYLEKSYSLIRSGDLEDAGRGVIPKTVMTDSRLSLKAKAVYAYFCAFAGSGNSACPKKDTILRHLGVSRNSLDKYLGQLRSLNYLTVVQRHTDGLLSVNDYILNRNPDLDAAETTHKVCVTHQVLKNSEEEISDSSSQLPNFSEAEKNSFLSQLPKNQEVQNQEAQIQELRFSEDIRNSTDNNSFLSATDFDQRQGRAADRRRERAALFEKFSVSARNYTKMQTDRQDRFTENYLAEKKLEKAIGEDRKNIRAAVEILTEDDRFGVPESYADFPDGEEQFHCYCLYRDSLAELLYADSPVRGEVLKGLEKFIDPQECILSGLYESIQPSFLDPARTEKIRMPKKYMKKCIVNALQKGRGEE